VERKDYLMVAANDPERKSRVEPVPEGDLDDKDRRRLDEFIETRIGHDGVIFYPGDEVRGDNDD
jgi:hypothetical protein